MIPLTSLQSDAVVRVVAPCGVLDRQSLLEGITFAEQHGFRVRVDDNVFATHRYLAGDDALRLKAFQHALAEPDSQALWIARGGYGAARLVGQLKVEQIQRAAKWLIGFSDVTVLHALWFRAGLKSVHGANMVNLPSWSSQAQHQLFHLLTEQVEQLYRGQYWCGPHCTVKGRLIGGNLTVLASLAGTQYWPERQGNFVFIEDIGESPYRIDRTLNQLMQSNFFQGTKAVVVGQLTGCDDERDPDRLILARDIMIESLSSLQIPVVGGFAFGHEPTSQALLLGAEATLDTTNGHLRIFPQ